MIQTQSVNLKERAGHTVKAQRDNHGSTGRGNSKYVERDQENDETKETYMETQTNVVKGTIPTS